MTEQAIAQAMPVLDPNESPSNVIPLTQFLTDFGSGLLDAVSRQHPPIYDGTPDVEREAIMDGLLRNPFPAQREVVQATSRLLLDADERAAIINAEMGTGKTMMAIALASVMRSHGYRRSLVLSPPHLVYKWRREILETVPEARVWVLNGPDTLRKLLKLRAMIGERSNRPEYFILGRVRMRLGFDWQPALVGQHRYLIDRDEESPRVDRAVYAGCPRCGTVVTDREGEPVALQSVNADRRMACSSCREPLWTLFRRGHAKDHRELVLDGLQRLPTIGPKSAERLLSLFGADLLGSLLEDNVYQFINLMDEDGDLVFTDRQAKRMERAMARLEFGLGQGGYQASEFIKRYLPTGFFDLLIADEGHEYKNSGSAQGQAMGVVASQCRKAVLLTGTLVGGYADDLFHLLWRLIPHRLIEDGFIPNQQGSIGSAAMSFMQEHGVLKEVYKETDDGAHRTAKGSKVSVHVSKAPGFGPRGIARFVLPYTVFLKLKDIGDGVLPSYDEVYHEVPMTDAQSERYASMQSVLTAAMKEALRKGDHSLLGVVMNVLLAWPDTCFREELIRHPRSRETLSFTPSMFEPHELMPKEEGLLDLCRTERAAGRRCLVYTTYTGKRDTTARLKGHCIEAGLKPAVLKASVPTDKREDWIMEQVDRGVDVLITNPELVKTGLDLLDFPTIAFMQTGYNVYTVQQAARRSWRIGQKQPVQVHFFGYEATAQTTCLSLMAKKIAVSQSTSGDIPDSGLDILNADGDSVEVALARQLVR